MGEQLVVDGGTARGRAGAHGTDRAPVPARHMVALDPEACLELLGSVPLGRIVFTKDALPAVRPVNHLFVDGAIVIRAHDGAALAAVAKDANVPGAVVAFETDLIDPDTHLGWSVVATGYARLVTDPAQLLRFEALLQPWVDAPMTTMVRIEPELVTGFRLVAGPASAVPDGRRAPLRTAR
jgi:hypothetical protein